MAVFLRPRSKRVRLPEPDPDGARRREAVELSERAVGDRERRFPSCLASGEIDEVMNESSEMPILPWIGISGRTAVAMGATMALASAGCSCVTTLPLP